MNGYSLKNAISINDHFLGKIGSRISLVEYGSYECPYTKQNQVIIDKIISYFSFEICFAFRHFPNKRRHRHALGASMAAEAAHLQGRFWDMHKALMDTHAELNTENIFNIARHVGLDIKTFLYDLEDPKISTIVEKYIQEANVSGVKKTPTIFINNHTLTGLVHFDHLREIIEDDLENSNLSLSP
jgi:protein-disulfide isomerase